MGMMSGLSHAVVRLFERETCLVGVDDEKAYIMVWSEGGQWQWPATWRKQVRACRSQAALIRDRRAPTWLKATSLDLPTPDASVLAPTTAFLLH